jgi:Mn2+/Fe2+ NRAMP family transporter
MYFIILTAALTLHKHGITKVETSAQAAEALKPFAGKFASMLFTIGIVGVGLLAIPTLTGSAAYAFAETFRWKQGLDKPLNGAKAFYAVVIFSTLVGIGLDYAHINAVQALVWSAVVNGVLAPVLMIGILIIAADKKLMAGKPSSFVSLAMVTIATVLMIGAAVAMFWG